MFLFISKPDFACNPYALWKYISENTEHETAWLVTEKRHLESLRKRGIRCELYDTVKGNELVKQATYVVSNVYIFGALPKYKNQIFVNLWHGSGIKAHDFYDVNLHPQQLRKVLKFSSETDLLCVHSLDDRFRLSAMLHFDLRKAVVTGQPRLDCVKLSEGKKKLATVLGDRMLEYEKLIFFVPSFRANSSSHSGKFYSENVFRLNDFDNEQLKIFLEQNRAALIYKLHPIEQTALKGVNFSMNANCFELTDEMLFDADVRYNEFLNAFDVLVSDYSSIAYDFLLLDRPIVYLIPDYEEYKAEKGFVFHNIDPFMPGPKVHDFKNLLTALNECLSGKDIYKTDRQNVIAYRFDFQDENACKRCYDAIINYKVPVECVKSVQAPRLLPTSAEMLRKYLPQNVEVLDSTDAQLTEHSLEREKAYLYITEEIPDEYRKISNCASTDIANITLYWELKKSPWVSIIPVTGGVEYEHFQSVEECVKKDKVRIGFAGTIDTRIYFAMVQYLCEAFPECDIVFAGDIVGEFPAWLKGYDNLNYLGTITYEELPEVIRTFDVAVLPFYGEYQKCIPKELFQYLACGKPVVTSNMTCLPECKAIYRSTSVADAVLQMKQAMEHRGDAELVEAARNTAKEYDWSIIAEKIIKDTW